MKSVPRAARSTSKLPSRRSIKSLKIVGELNNEVISALIDAFYLRPLDEEVHVVVSSEGGNSEVYSTFVDCTRRHREAGLLTTVAVGEVFSGAPVIIAAGSPGCRRSYAHTLFGMHEPYYPEMGTDPAVLQAEYRALQSTIDRFYTLLETLTKTTSKTWRKRLSGKSMVTFDAKQALRWGLIDVIV